MLKSTSRANLKQRKVSCSHLPTVHLCCSYWTHQSFMKPPSPLFPFTLLDECDEMKKYSRIRGSASPTPPRPVLYYLNQVASQQLRLAGGDAVVQHVPALAQPELHDVMLDRCGVIGRRDPSEQDSLLRAIGCEAPWLGKQHQWLGGT